jgi:hypothetical protein
MIEILLSRKTILNNKYFIFKSNEKEKVKTSDRPLFQGPVKHPRQPKGIRGPKKN